MWHVRAYEVEKREMSYGNKVVKNKIVTLDGKGKGQPSAQQICKKEDSILTVKTS